MIPNEDCHGWDELATVGMNSPRWQGDMVKIDAHVGKIQDIAPAERVKHHKPCAQMRLVKDSGVELGLCGILLPRRHNPTTQPFTQAPPMLSA
jgi:hypothetical protein